MKVFIAGEFGFPQGLASTERIKNLALGLADIGVEVIIIPLTEFVIDSNNEDYLIPYSKNISFCYNPGISNKNNTSTKIKISNSKLTAKLKWIFTSYYITYKATKKFKKNIEPSAEDVLFLYGRSFLKLHPILKIFKTKNCHTVFDIVEIPESFHGLGGRLSPIYYDWQKAANKIPALVDSLSVISTSLKKRFEKLNSNIYILPATGVWPNNEPDVQPLGLKKPFVFFYLGALIKKDDPEVLCGVFEKLVERLGVENVKLVIAGRYKSTPEGQSWVKKINNNEKLKNAVELIGELDNESLKKRMSEIDGVFLLRKNAPAEINSFPTRIVEFLQLGKPLFTTDIGDIGIYVKDEEDAILLPHNNNELAANKIISFLKNEKLLNELGLSGWRAGKKYLNRKVHAQKLIASFDRTHNNHSSIGVS